MAASKPDDVGQMRSSSGTSMKRMTKDDTLFWVPRREVVSMGPLETGKGGRVERRAGLQANDAEDNNDNVEGEDVGDAQREAEDHGQDAEPVVWWLASSWRFISYCSPLDR